MPLSLRRNGDRADSRPVYRIHREGQTRVCVIYRFLTSGTVDEVIYQRQLTKLALSGSIMVCPPLARIRGTVTDNVAAR